MPQRRPKKADPTPAPNRPLGRSEAIDMIIDIGIVEPLYMERKAQGEGYGVLVPVEQLHRLAREVKACRARLAAAGADA